ncbi:hypothetical protein [Wolbachia endosymbiont of Cantharis cryptica]|uniref:hypothetical protein n=1 Tax=Wolbachia endosymbiont of Cantharis cryptica TaxID=3066132 RepID=UPI00376F0FC6
MGWVIRKVSWAIDTLLQLLQLNQQILIQKEKHHENTKKNRKSYLNANVQKNINVKLSGKFSRKQNEIISLEEPLNY